MAVETAGHAAVEAATSVRALKALEDERFDAVFLDVRLGAEDGLEVLETLLKADPAVCVVMFTAYANISTAVEAMRRGAFDFLPKPFTPEQIRTVLGKVAKHRSLESRVRSLESDLAGSSPPLDLESSDASMQRALDVAFKAASSSATVLLLGPSGTGKSVLAREIHKRSPRRDAPFITVSCPSLSRELLESDLFGHVKGAFTGAIADAEGKVAGADGGTRFLDEIGEMPPEIQPKLLRLLQEREYERVGEARPRRADVRLIAATNRNLAAEVQSGRFRDDLYYRLNVISVSLPSLKERPADLPKLADRCREFFAARQGKRIGPLSPAVVAAFSKYEWPGNLRELCNVIERAVILSGNGSIDTVDLPEELGGKSEPAVSVGARVTIEALEAEHIRRVIAAAQSFEEASRTLGIDPATLYRKRQRLGLR
jgi:NtrC-family two-component system response regulator AlgB